MSEQHVKLQGYVTSIPQDERKCRIAIQVDDSQYRVLPKGAGVDLAEEVNALVQVSGAVESADETMYITVRGFTLLEDDGDWAGDDDQIRLP